MCGIFGVVVGRGGNVPAGFVFEALDSLFLLSESRGKEAAGIAAVSGDRLFVHKEPIRASSFIRGARYRALMQETLPEGVLTRSGAWLGHSRLVTNGQMGVNENNQPVVTDRTVGIHNGIVVNDAELWKRYPQMKRRSDVDSEALFRLVETKLGGGGDVRTAMQDTFAEIEGAASVAMLFADLDAVVLASNNGSLYWAYSPSRDFLVFCSETLILKELLGTRQFRRFADDFSVAPVRAGQAVLMRLGDGTPPETFSLRKAAASAAPVAVAHRAPRGIVELSDEDRQARRRLRRCTRCILPETMPFIRFDGDGVCNYCHSYKKSETKGVEALRQLVAPYRRTDGSPDCIVAVSGGRDSTYGLHYLKTVMGMNPIAYTFDWGMVTDLARRNISRICGKLGIEHILVSADIRRKRENIRKNIEAWLRQPDLGMVPLFMAGDKEYFYHADRLQKQLGIELIFFCSNGFEKTNFKTGFCGVRERNADDGPSLRLDSVSLTNKLKLGLYYAGHFATNPGYWNSSLADTGRAFLYSYFTKHDYQAFFDYVRWDESEIDRTLRTEYNWETARDTDTTWRIGDGTAAFYNYIYYAVAGFSEIDTFRSNQVREGLITREEALKVAERENQPRYESLREYARVVGFDSDRALQVIDAMRKKYAPPSGPAASLSGLLSEAKLRSNP